MLVLRPEILTRQVSLLYQLARELVPYVDVLTAGRTQWVCLANSTRPMLSSNTLTLGDPRMGIRKTNTPLT